MRTLSFHDFYGPNLPSIRIAPTQVRQATEALTQHLQAYPEAHLLLDFSQVPDLTVSFCLVFLPFLLTWNETYPNKIVLGQVSDALKQTMTASLLLFRQQSGRSQKRWVLPLWENKRLHYIGDLGPGMLATWEVIRADLELSETLANRRQISQASVRRHLNRLAQLGLVQKRKQGKQWLYYRLDLKARLVDPSQPNCLASPVPDTIDLFTQGLMAQVSVGSLPAHYACPVSPNEVGVASA